MCPTGTMTPVRPFDPRLMRYARSARRHVLVSAALGILTAVLVIAQAFLISRAATPVIRGTAALPDVVPVVLLLAAVVSVRAVSVGLRDALGRRAADGTIRELRAALVTKSERLGPRWRSRHGSDTATLLTRGLEDLEPYFVRFLPQLVLVSTVTPLALATILVLDFWSALIAALTIPLIPIFMVLIGRFTQNASARKLTSMERLGSQLLDLMSGLPTLRALGREDGPRDHIRRLGAENTRTTMATLRIAFLSGGALEFLATLSVALVAVEVGMRMVYGHVDLATGLVVIMLAPEVFEPLRQVGAQYHASANGVAAAASAFDILETDEPERGTSPAPDPAAFDVVLDDVWMAARGTWAPAGVSATIAPRSIVALRGPSGAGKTTAAMVLLGLERPTRGRVLLRPRNARDSSLDLAQVDPAAWWRVVTWVPQSPALLPGTVRSNLTEDPNPQDLRDAAAATGLDDVVSTLPEGWDTPVGQGGVGLSVGQRQRLALTRALLEDSRLIVLDEPTAHLDALSEHQVVDTILRLREGGRTVVVIAHRAAVVEAADQVLDIASREATPEEASRWPELVRVEELSDVTVEIPRFLDPESIEPDAEVSR